MCTLSELVSESDGISSQWVWEELKTLIGKIHSPEKVNKEVAKILSKMKVMKEFFKITK